MREKIGITTSRARKGPICYSLFLHLKHTTYIKYVKIGITTGGIRKGHPCHGLDYQPKKISYTAYLTLVFL